MENDSGALILFIVFILLLIFLRLAKFFHEFEKGKRYYQNEMRHAADIYEYRYWHMELRCHYLCLIPFVNERNVMRVYPLFFRSRK